MECPGDSSLVAQGPRRGHCLRVQLTGTAVVSGCMGDPGEIVERVGDSMQVTECLKGGQGLTEQLSTSAAGGVYQSVPMREHRRLDATPSTGLGVDILDMALHGMRT